MEEELKDKTQEQEPKEVTVAEWVKKFESSEKVMKVEFKPRYELAKKRLRAEHDLKNLSKLTHDQVALVSSIGNNFVNSVYFKAPKCNLTAREEVEHDRVENTEVKVNDILSDKKVKRVVKKNIWDAYLGGFGAVLIDYEYDDIEDTSNVLDPGIPEGTIDPFTGLPVEPVPPKYGRIVLKNEITIQRLRPDLVRFPKGFDFDNYQESPWIGYDLIMPIQDVRSNESWDKAVRDSIKGEKFEKVSNSEKASSDSDGDELYARISFCFVRPKNPLEKMILYVFCKGEQSNYLQRVEYDKGHVGYPIKFIHFNPTDDDCSYPVGDPWLFEGQLNAVDRWWRTYSRRVERNHPKNVYDVGNLSKGEAQNLKSNNDLQWVGIENKQKKPLSDIFYQFQHPSIPREVTDFYTVARQLISELGPRASISTGSQDPSNKPESATEAKILQAGEMIDVDARADDVADLIKDIVLDIAGILTKIAYPMPVKQEIQGQEIIKEVDKDGFTDKINVDIEVESMRPQNKDVLRAQLERTIGLLVKIQPLMESTGTTLYWPFWLEKLFDTFSIRNVDKGIVQLPPRPIMPQGPSPSGAEQPIPTGAIPQEGVEAGRDMVA